MLLGKSDKTHPNDQQQNKITYSRGVPKVLMNILGKWLITKQKYAKKFKTGHKTNWEKKQKTHIQKVKTGKGKRVFV